MTEPTTTDTGPEIPDVETCLAQLRDPAVLLAEAVRRIHVADIHMPDRADQLEQALYQLKAAEALARIVSAAAHDANVGRHENVVDAEDDEPGLQVWDSTDDRPVPVQGVRFTAHLEGQVLGVVGNVPWLWVPGVGFLAGHGGLFAGGHHGSDEGTYLLTLGGRVVSRAGQQALCITDGGIPVALPHDVLTLSSEDDR